MKKTKLYSVDNNDPVTITDLMMGNPNDIDLLKSIPAIARLKINESLFVGIVEIKRVF
jgi:hypothetical protein